MWLDMWLDIGLGVALVISLVVTWLSLGKCVRLEERANLAEQSRNAWRQECLAERAAHMKRTPPGGEPPF